MKSSKVAVVCICCIFVIIWIFSFDRCIVTRTLLHASGRSAAREAVLVRPPPTSSISDTGFKPVNQSDIILTVKTTRSLHIKRMELILKTWRKGFESQVYFITDDEDPVYEQKLGDHLIYAKKCGKTYGLFDLCCKTGMEYLTAMKSGGERLKWWCHFDDDSYVNVPRLLEVLNLHNPSDPVYIGRKSRPFMPSTYKGKPIKAIYGTGGAGYCITKQVMDRMTPWMGDARFGQICLDLNMAEDCSFGYAVTEWLQVPLTESLLLHSHLEQLKTLPPAYLTKQASLSYKMGENLANVVSIPEEKAAFNITVDPTRMLSIHCLNFPKADICP